VATLTRLNLPTIQPGPIQRRPSIKRLLPTGSISHAGYVRLGLVAGNETGINGIAVYVLGNTLYEPGRRFWMADLRCGGRTSSREDLDDIGRA